MNNKNRSRAIMASIAAAAAIAAIVIFASQNSVPIEAKPTSQVGTPAADKEVALEDSITKATYFSINNASGPSTAIDPKTETIYVTFIKTTNDTSNLYLQRSEDGGKTFSVPIRVNNKENDVNFMSNMPPQVKVGPGGQVYVLWTKTDFSPALEARGFGDFGFSSMRFASSLEGGKTFSQAVYVEKDEANSQIFPAFDVSPDDEVYVGWISQAGSQTAEGAPVKLARSIDGGRTFEPSVKVDEPANPCSNVDVAAGAKSVYVSFRKVLEAQEGGSLADPFTKAVKDIVVARSDDGGKTFSGSQKVSDDRFMTNLCIDAGGRMTVDKEGRLHVVWCTGNGSGPGIYYANSAGGQTLSKPIPVYTSDWVPATMVGMASDENNNLWITWELTSNSTNTDQLQTSSDQEHGQVGGDATMIQVAVVSPDGKMIMSQVGDSEGKRPVIAAGKGSVALSWNSRQGIQVGILSGPYR